MATTTDRVDLVGPGAARNLARAALLAALTGAFAYVSFPNPLSPGVPVTLQVLGVFLAGILLGPRWGAVSLALYLAAGAAGLPMFASGGAGVGALFGLTGGYLWSYPVAAGVVGLVVHGRDGLRDPGAASLARLVGATLAGTVVVYAFGVAGYAYVAAVGPVEAFLAAAAVFVPAELVKVAAAVGVVRSDAIAAA